MLHCPFQAEEVKSTMQQTSEFCSKVPDPTCLEFGCSKLGILDFTSDIFVVFVVNSFHIFFFLMRFLGQPILLPCVSENTHGLWHRGMDHGVHHVFQGFEPYSD